MIVTNLFGNQVVPYYAHVTDAKRHVVVVVVVVVIIIMSINGP